MKRATLIALLGSVSLSMAACGPSDSDFVEFDTFHSPDGKHRVVVETAPKYRLAYAPAALRFYSTAREASERSLLATASLANDGSRLTDVNIRAEWVDANTVRFCLSGDEQDDEAVFIDVVNATFFVEPAECGD